MNNESKQTDPIEQKYYLTKTIEDKWGIAYWDGIKFWDDPNQDRKLSFGIKREWIKEWYDLPIQQTAPLIAEINRLKAENEWIPVSERLPKRKGYYLAVVDESVASKNLGCVEIQDCFETIVRQPDGNLEIINTFKEYVTHWRPLPTPPEK